MRIYTGHVSLFSILGSKPVITPIKPGSHLHQDDGPLFHDMACYRKLVWKAPLLNSTTDTTLLLRCSSYPKFYQAYSLPFQGCPKGASLPQRPVFLEGPPL